MDSLTKNLILGDMRKIRKVKVRFAYDGRPLFTENQLKFIDILVKSQSCPVCRAKVGKPCKTVDVHMGRLPNKFDLVEIIEKLNVR